MLPPQQFPGAPIYARPQAFAGARPAPAPQFAGAQFGPPPGAQFAQAPQFAAAPQFAGAPPMQQYRPAAAQPPVPAQRQMQQQIPSFTPPPVTQPMPGFAPQAAPTQAMPPAPAMQGFPGAAMPPAAAAGATRPFTPSGAEMLQVTVFGVQNCADIQNPIVKVEVPGKHQFEIATQVLAGDNPCLNPKSTITYIKQGDGLIFSVVGDKPGVGEYLFGQAQVNNEDYYPNGFEGDVVVGTNDPPEVISVKLSCLGENGQIQQLAPVVVKGTSAPPVQDGAPIIAGSSAPRLCSPEEFQWACNQPGAAPPVTLTPGELAQLGAPPGAPPAAAPAPAAGGFGQPQPAYGGAPGAFQPMYR